MKTHHHFVRPGAVWLGLCLAICLSLPSAAQSVEVDYPEARRVDQVDVYHGVEVADPYRWMEDLESDELHLIDPDTATADGPGWVQINADRASSSL